jgi:hypothetical protein
MEATTKQLILSSKNFQTEYPKDFKENDHWIQDRTWYLERLSNNHLMQREKRTSWCNKVIIWHD